MQSFHAAAWFLWSSSKAADNILSSTFLLLGDASILALYSLMTEASPLGRPTELRLPLVFDTTAVFFGLPTRFAGWLPLGSLVFIVFPLVLKDT